MILKEEDTICWKVNRCMEQMQNAVKYGKFDVKAVTEHLQAIRSDALVMESALKDNKKLRAKYNIDAEYKALRHDTMTPPGINTMPTTNTYTREKAHYEVIVKDKGKIIYQNKVFAFLICAVERIEDIDIAGMIDGNAQVFMVGHDVAIWYAFDQLQQKMSAKLTQIMSAMKYAVKEKKFGDSEWKKKLLHTANNYE